MISFRQWVLAVFSALALHAVIILPFLPDTTDPVVAMPEGGMEIGLGTGLDAGDGTGEFVADGDDSDAAEVATTVKVVETIAKPVVGVIKQPVSPVQSQPEVMKTIESESESVEVKTLAASDNTLVIAQVNTDALSSNADNTSNTSSSSEAVNPDAANEKNDMQTFAPAVVSQNGSALNASSKHNGKRGSRFGNGRRGGNGLDGVNGKARNHVLRRYFSDIAALIDANKNYPGEVKKEKQEGTVLVAFSINRQGELLSSVVRKSSGYALLDKAALSTLQRSSPFPPIPEVIERDTLKIAVPIDYALITH